VLLAQSATTHLEWAENRDEYSRDQKYELEWQQAKATSSQAVEQGGLNGSRLEVVCVQVQWDAGADTDKETVAKVGARALGRNRCRGRCTQYTEFGRYWTLLAPMLLENLIQSTTLAVSLES